MTTSDLRFELKVIGTRDQIMTFMASGSSSAMITNGTITPVTTNDDDDGPANVNAPAVDSAGLPWDGRIHSDKKSQAKDGTWRKRRNVDTNLVATVEAELRARGAAGMYMPPPNNAPPITTPITPPPQNYQQPGPGPQVYQPPQNYQQPGPGPQYQQPGMTTPQPQYQQPGPAPMDFNSFMSHLSSKMSQRDQAGMPVIDAGYLAGLSQHLSQMLGRPINHIAEISNDPNAVQMAITKLTMDGKW